MVQIGSPRQIYIHFLAAELDRLQAKLDDARLPSKPIVEDVEEPCGYGTDLEILQTFLAHWKAGNPEDSSQRAEKLNKHPHYEVEIEGITVHYQHFKPDPSLSSSRPAIPLIFTHGWPGVFTEAHHFASRLIESRAPAFEVIVPSLPGFGLSSQPPREGGNMSDNARVFDTLMTSVLGFESYFAQGGDWGTMVTRFLATYPACKIYHANFAPPLSLPLWVYGAFVLEMLTGLTFQRVVSMLGYSSEDRFQLQRSQEFMTTGNAYTKIQGTRPATLGYALYDDPVAILSWLLEKFKAWSDPRCPAFVERGKGNSDSQLTEENVLIDVMIYYLTKSVHTSLLPYRHSDHLWGKACIKPLEPARNKPYAHSAFPYEIVGVPRSWIPRSSFNLVHYRRHEYGGHFAALDNP